MSDIISIAFLTGFIGDSLLQIGSKQFCMGGSSGWGLKDYFEQHGAAESLCIAGGMMTFFYIIYYYTVGFRFNIYVNYIFLAIYGILLDFIFRKTMIFNSLTGYYKHFNFFWSAVWGAIPLMLPFFIYNIIHHK